MNLSHAGSEAGARVRPWTNGPKGVVLGTPRVL
jgi:hypothetical protein